MPAFDPNRIPKNPNAQPGQALDRSKVMRGGNLAQHIDKDPRIGAVFSAPINGQSWTTPPKAMPWEQPPKFTNVEKAMNFLMHQLLESQHLKALLTMLDGGMAVEAIARTILFAGFQQGLWTPDLGMLMYKPLMMSIIAIAHKAKIHHAPIVLKQTLDKNLLNRFKHQDLFAQAREKADTDKFVNKRIAETMPPPAEPNGFMRKP